MSRIVAACLSLCCLTLFNGCSPTRSLVANDGSNRLIGASSDGQVTVVITTNAWHGDSAVSRDFSVVHMLVHNQSSQPVLLAPGDFDLIDERGFRYLLQDAGGKFEHAQSNRNSSFDQGYDSGRNEHYDRTDTTDADFAESALPWGVLLPGTQMRGYLYFEPIVRTANAATLYWHSQTPDHNPLTTFGFRLRIAQTPS